MNADQTVVVMLAAPDFGEGLGRRLKCVERRRSRGGEIAHIGKIGALAVFDPLDQLRRYGVEIEITLTVGMGAQIERHAVEGGRKIRAVIQIEPAQEVLIGLART